MQLMSVSMRLKSTQQMTILVQYIQLYLNGDRVKLKLSKGAKTRNQYNQVPHMTQDTNGKVTKYERGQRSGNDTINYHTWPRIPIGN